MPEVAKIGRGYTSKALIESFLRSGTISDDLTSYILSAQELIENTTGRIFAPDETETARLFDGNGCRELLISDCAEITKLEVATDEWGDNFTEVPDTEYKTYPNEANVPIRKLILRYIAFFQGYQNIKVTAKWGWKAIPADITFVATALAGGMYNAQLPSNNLKSESIGNYSVSYGDKDWDNFDKLKAIMKQYENIQI